MITLKECCKIHPCFSSAIGILNLTLCEFISNNQNLINFIFLQILNDNLTILIEKVKLSSIKFGKVCVCFHWTRTKVIWDEIQFLWSQWLTRVWQSAIWKPKKCFFSMVTLKLFNPSKWSLWEELTRWWFRIS